MSQYTLKDFYFNKLDIESLNQQVIEWNMLQNYDISVLNAQG